ncbi:MAG: FMN-binding protein, partial [Pseudoflavonifractor sp.]
MMKKLSAVLLATAMIMSLAACSGGGAKPTTPAGKFTPGTYSGESTGYDGAIKVDVVLSADKIDSVTVTESHETDGIGSKAVEQLPAAIVTAQSVAVDSISGATISSDGIIAAVT